MFSLPQQRYDAVDNLTFEPDGHYHLSVPAFYNFGSYANKEIEFIFDTGAFFTVITREAATDLGYIDRFTIQEGITLSGFSGECMADLKEIPGIIIGGRKLEGVRVAVPHIHTDISILGLNVIEHFKFFVDTENDKIYFAENPSPEIPEQLQARSIYAISEAAYQ